MSRPKYAITAADVAHASDYLRPLLQTCSFELRTDVSYRVAERDFNAAIELRGKEERAIELNAWCEKYLTSSTWAKLKLSIRKRRERKTRRGETTTITITTQAGELLRKVSERDNVTYSETLEFYLAKALQGKARNS